MNATNVHVSTEEIPAPNVDTKEVTGVRPIPIKGTGIDTKGTILRTLLTGTETVTGKEIVIGKKGT